MAMTRTRSFVAPIVLLIPFLTPVHTQTVSSAHADILVKSDSSWNGKPYTAYPHGRPQLTVLKMTIPAHTALPWHIHPMPNAGYVLSGQLTIEDRATGNKQTFQTGQAFAESVNDAHRGISGDQPTALIITYSGTPSLPTSVPVKGEKPEY